jgi:hypothetical protein
VSCGWLPLPLTSHAAGLVAVQTQRTPIDIARERGAFRMLKRLHGAVNQQGQAKFLFRDEARYGSSTLHPLALSRRTFHTTH